MSESRVPVSPHSQNGRVGGVREMARSQCRSSISHLCVGVNWIEASMVYCRRQWYGCGTVFEPSRSRGRLYLKRTWLAGVWVGVTRERRAISHGRGSHQG